jgi:RNA polymerase sigma factor (sigma-70 family)
LLRWLGVPATREAYIRFLAQTCPESGATLLLTAEERQDPDAAWRERRRILRALRQPSGQAGAEAREFAHAWRVVTGCLPDEANDPETQLVRQEETEQLVYALQHVSLHQRVTVAMFFGLLGEREHTLEEVGEALAISSSRAGQIVRFVLRKLRHSCRWVDGDLIVHRRYRCNGASPPFRLGLAFPSVDAERQLSPQQKWLAMPAPLAPRHLLRSLFDLLHRLGESSAVCSATPSLTRWLADGTEQIEACWEGGGHRLRLLRRGHIQVRHGGGERLVSRLEAEVSGLPARTRILLRGPLGQLDRYRVDGPGARIVSAAWRSVLGMEPCAEQRFRENDYTHRTQLPGGGEVALPE